MKPNHNIEINCQIKALLFILCQRYKMKPNHNKEQTLLQSQELFILCQRYKMNRNEVELGEAKPNHNFS